MENKQNTVTLVLTDREVLLLQTLVGINVSVPAAVVNRSQLHVDERDNDGRSRGAQKAEVAELLYNIQCRLNHRT